MRTGDADLTLWLRGGRSAQLGRRHWCLQVASHRAGKFRSAQWQVPVYRWSVELWGDLGEDSVLETPTFTVKTFAEALRRARREAVKLERQAAKERRA